MSIKDQMEAYRVILDKWAGDDGGSCKIAGDLSQLVNLLGLKPGALRVVMFWDGETPRGEMDEAEGSRVDRRFWAVFSRGQGLKLNPAESLTVGSGGGRPLFDVVEDGRDLIRCVMLDPQSTERPTYYSGTDRLDIPGFTLDAYVVKWSVGSDIGVITADPEQQQEI